MPFCALLHLAQFVGAESSTTNSTKEAVQVKSMSTVGENAVFDIPAWLIGIIVILALVQLLAIVFYIYNRRRRKRKQEQLEQQWTSMDIYKEKEPNPVPKLAAGVGHAKMSERRLGRLQHTLSDDRGDSGTQATMDMIIAQEQRKAVYQGSLDEREGAHEIKFDNAYDVKEISQRDDHRIPITIDECPPPGQTNLHHLPPPAPLKYT